MNLLAITRHHGLVENLRMAFEGAGHRVDHVEDPLAALAQEAWSQAHLILVDADGEPVDGYRLCGLLRGEARLLFQGLPIFMVVAEPPGPEEQRRLDEAGGDGFLEAGSSIQHLLDRLGPAVEGSLVRADPAALPVLALGFRKGEAQRMRSALDHFGFQVHAAPRRGGQEAARILEASLVLLSVDTGGERALELLEAWHQGGSAPYVILVGEAPNEAMERRLLVAGAADWLPSGHSPTRLLHACRRGLEWVHARRVQREFDGALWELREQRAMLEIEAAALRTQVLTDPLTGLLNRRAFDQNLDHAFNQWRRHGRSFVLILGDVDHFKLINDRFGHPIGDEVLKQLARRISSNLRKSDLAFRIGGEEFAVLLFETQLKAGAEVADKLRRRIDEEPMVISTGQTLFPSMSFGVGAPDGLLPDTLTTAVDQALYRAKAMGRNRVVVAEGNAPQAKVSGS